jgi:hypothetical protein
MTPEDQDAVFSDLARRRFPSGGAPLAADFLFQTRQGPRRRGDFGILNLHPAPPGVDGLLGGEATRDDR